MRKVLGGKSSTFGKKAATNGHSVRVGVNGFVIARDTEAQAQQVLQEIIDKANPQAVEGFAAEVKMREVLHRKGKGTWAKSSFEDLVQYNDGFKTNLIGTPQQIAERIIAIKQAGADLLLLGFLHFQEEVEYFGREILPRVRELERQEQNHG